MADLNVSDAMTFRAELDVLQERMTGLTGPITAREVHYSFIGLMGLAKDFEDLSGRSWARAEQIADAVAPGYLAEAAMNPLDPNFEGHQRIVRTFHFAEGSHGPNVREGRALVDLHNLGVEHAVSAHLLRAELASAYDLPLGAQYPGQWVANGLKALRGRAGFYQATLALEVGISQGQVSQMETGGRGIRMRLSTVADWARACGHSLVIWFAADDSLALEIATAVSLLTPAEQKAVRDLATALLQRHDEPDTTDAKE